MCGAHLDSAFAGLTSCGDGPFTISSSTPIGVSSRVNQDERLERLSFEPELVDYDKEKLQERLAKLAGGVAVIKVGAATEVEQKEKKHRIEDALSATKAGVEEGMVAGGGGVLLAAQRKLDDGLGLEGDQRTGVMIVRRALEEPLRQIAQNAGKEGSVIVEAVRRCLTLEGIVTDPPGVIVSSGRVRRCRGNAFPGASA